MTGQNQGNVEWTALSSSWQSIEEHPRVVASSLRDMVHREDRRLRIWRVFEIVLSIGVVAATIAILAVRPGAISLVIAIDTWVVLGVVWIFALASGKGLLLPAMLSTTEYLGLARRQALRRLHTVYLALALLFGQMIVLAALMVADAAYRSVSVLQVIAVVAWLGWAAWARRKAIADLDALSQFDRSLDT
jgi:hypothetical protein